jgi:hypothetical protein
MRARLASRAARTLPPQLVGSSDHKTDRSSAAPAVGHTFAAGTQSLQIESIGALACWSSMIFSENRLPLFRIML